MASSRRTSSRKPAGPPPGRPEGPYLVSLSYPSGVPHLIIEKRGARKAVHIEADTRKFAEKVQDALNDLK